MECVVAGVLIFIYSHFNMSRTIIHQFNCMDSRYNILSHTSVYCVDLRSAVEAGGLTVNK